MVWRVEEEEVSLRCGYGLCLEGFIYVFVRTYRVVLTLAHPNHPLFTRNIADEWIPHYSCAPGSRSNQTFLLRSVV